MVARLGVERHSSDRRPVASLARPAFWLVAPGTFVEGMTAGQDGDLGARVALVRRDVPDRAVAMLAVVPAHEPIHPTPRGALDQSAGSGPGVDAVHVWAYPDAGSGQPPVFL